MQAPPPSEGYGGRPGKPKSNYTWVWILVGVLGVCGCGGVLLAGALLFPVFAQARLAAVRTACISNVKRVGMAQIMYTADNDDHFLAAGKWIDLTSQYASDSRVFTCPAVARKRGEYGYAMSAKVGGTKASNDPTPQSTILLYESDNLVRNASGNPSSEANPNRHGNGRTEGHIDGSVKFVRASGSTSGSE